MAKTAGELEAAAMGEPQQGHERDVVPVGELADNQEVASNTISNGKCYVRPSLFHWKARAFGLRAHGRHSI